MPGKGILVCSDIEKFGQRQLLALYPDLKTDVVIMPHHGSTRNLIDGFAEKLGAENVIISCSRRRYESAFKPNPPVRGFYTPQSGAVKVTITPKGKLKIAGMNNF